ncbi:U3 small nucleolar RNA-associated protein 21 homolog isoform X1 [Miscanthus floridulus]|uniref:U3 small nucleolar RNA-associated protein 21 homolog isoform X1 n=1 Tax=Miscanthus floridulus TaxID=154761 RepID=UPI00345AA936
MGIFEPFRAIGYITAGGVPFSVQRLGTETFVTVSVGKAFHVYNCAKLNLVLAGPQLPKKIRAIACYKDYTFAAYGSDIAVFKRTDQVATWSRHEEKVNMLYLFGEYVLSADAKGNIFMWAFRGAEPNSEPVGSISLGDKFTPSCIMHPDTFLNKVIVGSEEGPLQLWNISTKKKLYDFNGWNSLVRCCVSSPALDVVAVGCSDGSVHVHNVRYDEELMSFNHQIRGAVTALSFRTDGQPLLASGGSSGVISIWNLEKRRLHSVIREAHDGSIVSLHFFANEPILMSSAADNSIKIWIFDSNDGDARLLRFRSGHSAPPRCIRFYGNGKCILSAGQDRAFRLFSVIQDQQSRELSQRHVAKRAKRLRVKEEEIKLKPVVTFDCAEIRARDWCNVVTCHMDTPQAYVWRLQNFVIGEHVLTPSSSTVTPIKACVISACGNFTILGTEGGWIEKFNLQSGFSRGSYIDTSLAMQCAHDGEVVGLACDATNGSLISAGYHGDIKLWDFKTCKLKSRLDVGKSVTKIAFHRPNGLLATVAGDMVLILFDTVSMKMVRRFEGHTDRITDLCFSEDGKWLISSSMDGTLRIWDISLARQIDAMHVDVSITSISMSPNMDVLATTHVDQNGVYLWVNQSLFSASTNTENYGSGKHVRNVCLPAVSSAERSEEEQVQNSGESYKSSIKPFVVMDHQIPNLVTLSLLPKSQWQSLTNLDIIKVRNKPIEPPKKPEKAPFFLPSVPSLSGEILFEPPASTKETDISTTKNTYHKMSELSSHFSQLLQSCGETKDYSAFTDYLKGLSPSSLDMELRMLQIIDDEESEDLEQRPELQSISSLLDYFIHELSFRNNFEFVQAVLKLFLKIHGETIRRHSMLQSKVKKLLEVQSLVWQKIDKIFQGARCMVTFLSNSQF